jgi:nicotinamidase-related amidase
VTPIKELGVWTSDECALVLIDFQTEMFDTIRSETNADQVDVNVRLLAKTAKAFDMPIVLSTVGVGAGINGPTRASVLAELDGVEVIDRSSMNAFEDQAFRDAVKNTGRERLIIAGLHTEVCCAFAVVQGLKDGYDVSFVTDAVGGRSQVAHRTAIERLASAGAVPNTAFALLCELFREWKSPLAAKAVELSDWYFEEMPKVSKTYGVNHREKVTA